ncbi:MAG: hypothetical protein K5888_06530 [Lachnospiraceae bacterium]|nr:hypothetical protein [Lachnospiraceae bacterium]
MESNLINFIRMFLSYLLVVAVAAAVIAIAVYIGIRLRKSKNMKEMTENAEGSKAES